MSGAKKAQRVVAPVVAQVPFDEVPIVDVVMHRHQFDGRHAEVLQMPDRLVRSEARVGASHASPAGADAARVKPLTCSS